MAVGRGGEATAEQPVLATPRWGMLYADDAEIVSSPEQLRKMMKNDRGRWGCDDFVPGEVAKTAPSGNRTT